MFGGLFWDRSLALGAFFYPVLLVFLWRIGGLGSLVGLVGCGDDHMAVSWVVRVLARLEHLVRGLEVLGWRSRFESGPWPLQHILGGAWRC
ncbi:hypothetical protein M0R45_030121 [Rubus argutus]|uniref:Secreted protein n=1 Tax=Rubus argutus TaxID=59490 RepID=A0AAW1WEA9_RUBAR